MRRPQATRVSRRFGIGEWYGHEFTHLQPARRREFARWQALRKGQQPSHLCPFRSRPGLDLLCTKAGGVCSLRLYVQDTAGNVEVAPDPEGHLRTTCPYRFDEEGTIYQWVGKELLDCAEPKIVREVGFLSRPPNEDLVDQGGDVGRIDNVLLVPESVPLRWCALEIQAVYFQGSGMAVEYPAIANQKGQQLPFPVGNRRLDYRSSGPKRLMPQLEIKVPSLRRWGKKMAVVVDEDFFGALSPMDHVKDVSNCDIAWFIVRYEQVGNRAALRPKEVRLTTLERAVEGLTAGVPVGLNEFERRVQAKLART